MNRWRLLFWQSSVILACMGCARGGSATEVASFSSMSGRSISVLRFIRNSGQSDHSPVCSDVLCVSDGTTPAGAVGRAEDSHDPENGWYVIARESGPLQLDFDARGAGDQIWFVNTESNTVFAAIDLSAREAYLGANTIPRWAAPGGGIVLCKVRQ